MQAALRWEQGDGEIKRREDRRRQNIAPTTTLFVVNFDLDRTRERDLEDHFEPFGRLKRVQIKRNYAFVEYEVLDQAIDAVKHCHLSRLLGAPLLPAWRPALLADLLHAEQLQRCLGNGHTRCPGSQL